MLADVFKKDVYALARHVNSVVERREAIPESSMTKPPSAELAPNQFDQDTLPPYPLLDAILEMPIAHVLDHLPLPEATDAALRGRWIRLVVDPAQGTYRATVLDRKSVV